MKVNKAGKKAVILIGRHDRFQISGHFNNKPDRKINHEVSDSFDDPVRHSLDHGDKSDDTTSSPEHLCGAGLYWPYVTHPSL